MRLLLFVVFSAVHTKYALQNLDAFIGRTAHIFFLDQQMYVFRLLIVIIIARSASDLCHTRSSLTKQNVARRYMNMFCHTYREYFA